MRHFHAAVDQTDLVKGLDLGRQTTVNAEDLAFDDGTDAEVIEHLSAVLPGVDVTVLAHGLFVETVDGSDTTGLVVTSEESDAVGVLELQAEEKLEGLDGVITAIDEVTHENVAGVGDLTTFFEELKKIVELTVNITADGHWGAHWLHIALFNQNLLDLLAEKTEVTLGEDAAILNSGEP